MNTSELVDAIAARSGVAKADVRTVVEAALGQIQDTLAAGGDVRFVGFGTFSTVARAGRTGTNPRTGAPMTIPPTTYPRFAPGATLRAAVKGDVPSDNGAQPAAAIASAEAPTPAKAAPKKAQAKKASGDDRDKKAKKGKKIKKRKSAK